MSSLTAKDRVSLCSFTFSDGRRCRTPRTGKNPHFCFYHAQKEARAHAAETLGKDLAYFFSGDYLSACDLSTALASLIPAVVRGDVKPRTAHTVAYLVQTLMQAIHISQHEYINAFGVDTWRKAIRNSVNDGYNYRCPAAPQPAPSAFRETLRNEQPESPQPQPQPAQSQSQTQQPATQSAETPANCHSGAVAQAFRPEESASSSNSPLVTSPSPASHGRQIRRPRIGRSELVPIEDPDPVGARSGDRFLARHSACPTSPTQPSARRNRYELSFRAQRGICFFLFPRLSC